MRKLKTIEPISLCDVIQAPPSGPTEDGDYPDSGWAVSHRDPAVGEE